MCLESKYNYWLIVIQPCPGLSTGQVFSLWKKNRQDVRPDTETALRALGTGNLKLLCDSLGNVLQPVSESLRPEIARACADLSAEGAVFASMTGSGSAVFGVYRSSMSAEKAFRRLGTTYKTIFLCHTQHDSIRMLRED